MRTPLTKYINIHIYKYIFRSNSRGLAPLGQARPDKFINLTSRGTMFCAIPRFTLNMEMFTFLILILYFHERSMPSIVLVRLVLLVSGVRSTLTTVNQTHV